MDKGSENYPDHPPKNLLTIMVADDTGYVPSTIQALRNKGYSVADKIAQNLDEAIQILENWCPQVVLTDLNFPTEADGLALMNAALGSPSVKLVLAVSQGHPSPRTAACGCGGLLWWISLSGCRSHSSVDLGTGEGFNLVFN